MSIPIKTCPDCGQVNPAANPFCHTCGASLREVDEQRAPWKTAQSFPALPAGMQPHKRRRVDHETGGTGFVLVGLILVVAPLLLSTENRVTIGCILIGIAFVATGFWIMRTDPGTIAQTGMLTNVTVALILLTIGYKLASTGSSPVDSAQVATPTPAKTVVAQATPVAANVALMAGGDAAHTGNLAGPAPTGIINRLWRADTAGALYTTPAVANGLVYVGTKSGFLYAFDEQTGEERWRRDLGGDIVRTSPAIAGNIVVVGLGTTLFGIDALTGKPRWTLTVPLAGSSSPVTNGATVFIGFPSGAVIAVDAASGTKLWEMPIAGAVLGAPALAADRVIVATDNGMVYALLQSRGNIVWRYEGPDGIFAAPAVKADLIYVSSIGSGGRTVLALDLANGKVRWSYDAGGEAPVAIAGDLLIVPDSDGGIYAFDAAQGGEPIWLMPTGNPITAGPTVVGDTLYVASGATLFAVDVTTGTQQWRYATGYQIDTAPVVINGRIYLGGQTGYLDALSGTGPVAFGDS